MVGRKRENPGLQMLKGNPSRRPVLEPPKVRLATSVEPPFELSGHGLAWWNAHVKHLIDAEYFTEADVWMFANACRLWNVYMNEGERWGKRLAVLKYCSSVWRDFGLTPAERFRMSRRPMKETPGTKWGATLS
jgi:phage terminase small subunit